MSIIKEYSACPNCNNAMVFSFAKRGCEYVCLPCDEGEPMFNSRPKLKRTVKHMQSKKRKWSLELSIIGRRFGGGECAVCADYSCDICMATADKDYQFKIWRTRVEEPAHE